MNSITFIGALASPMRTPSRARFVQSSIYVVLRAAGIGNTLLRLSVGIEAEEDLVADLDRALRAAGESAVRPRMLQAAG
jgi:O-acetylhomoserine/O-acetylserine sulfhydrylase-like pyridoxal-dependent enzyme